MRFLLGLALRVFVSVRAIEHPLASGGQLSGPPLLAPIVSGPWMSMELIGVQFALSNWWGWSF
jgi:hypothetical protein